MWHTYLRLASTLHNKPSWREILNTLNEPFTYEYGKWTGDLFSRANPAWSDYEVIAVGKTGPRVVNNWQSREGAFELLSKV